jgi:hypothetical protein
MRSCVAAVVVCASGCEIESNQPYGEEPEVSSLLQGCEPQAWPIEEEGHQLNRVSELTPDGAPLKWWAPRDPVGIVFMLHANNKDASSMFSVEHEEFYNELAERNLAYAAVSNSGEAWSLKVTPDNADFLRVADVRDHLIAEGAIDASTPVFSVGFSGGSMFAPVLAAIGLEEGWDVRGYSSHNTGGKATPEVAAMFTAHANDNPEGIEAQYEDQALIGTPTELLFLAEEPLDPLRFTKIPGISESESLAYFDDLVSLGMIDGKGVRLVDDEQMGEALDTFENRATGTSNQRARNQLSVVWRKHIFSADKACAEAQFLRDQLTE